VQLIVGRKTKINAAETLHGEWILTTMGRLRRGNFRHCNWGQVKILLSVPSAQSATQILRNHPNVAIVLPDHKNNDIINFIGAIGTNA
jgi:hypothetical protein